jgi:hypothetical protein
MDRLGVLTEETCPDRVEGAHPGEAGDHRLGLGTEDFADDPLDAPGQFLRRPPSESRRQNAPGISAPDDPMGGTVREHVGLSRPCPSDDQQRIRDLAIAMQDRPELGFIE